VADKPKLPDPVPDEVRTHPSMLPTPDESAYDGNTIVKSNTYNKSKATKANGIDKVRKAYALLEKEAILRGTIERIQLDPEFILKIKELFKDNPSAIDFQIFINKEVNQELRKVMLQLKTFLQNNQ